MTPKKTFYFYNHQGKGTEYILALQRGGFTFAPPRTASAVFMDYDVGGRVTPIKSRFMLKKTVLFVYPHAARPNVGWDGLIPRSPHVGCVFVSADGHIEILRRIGIKQTIVSAGWAYCKIKDFQPIESPRKILFAPIHPTKRGFLSNIDKKLNQAAFSKLREIKDDFDITVRHIHPIEANGLRRESGINYQSGATDLAQSVDAVDESDIVIGHQTIAYIAVARGKPTLMFGEDVPPRNGCNENDFKYVQNFDEYKKLLMYPLDLLQTFDARAIINMAAHSDAEIADWRTRMIGTPFQPQVVVDTVTGFL